LEQVKWTLWHGKPQEALSKLELLMTMNVTDSLKRKKLEDLYDYLNRKSGLSSIIKNEISKDTHSQWLNLTSNQLLMLDIEEWKNAMDSGRST